ncbi:hypothetical protein K2173_001953 [Erythroxylum novogranatense]|uniref:SAWADEE domain-containing protein n=1 Tax=Erythroxylum novogranatense TaxID=1862640 RepID=A0AAV8SPT7_9ROSI|nr:hypothetical protein K2173_001953 [Erythroxylum novogranatense]
MVQGAILNSKPCEKRTSLGIHARSLSGQLLLSSTSTTTSLYSSSYRSTGDGLVVHFESSVSGVVLLKKDEVLTCLRFRSVPLQGDECSCIKEGDHVLASRDTGLDNLFCDAKVKKVKRVRHCRGPCRCTFAINWLHLNLKDEATVSSSSIMKLATGNINVHPIVALLLGSTKATGFSSASPLLTVSEDVNYEIDLTKLLEKQAKEISSPDDPYKKCIPAKTQTGIEVDKKQHCQLVLPIKTGIQTVEVLSDKKPRRITRNSSSLQGDVEVAAPPTPASPVEGDNSETRFCLSPLAACAALASRVQVTPKSVTVGGLFSKDKVFSDAPTDCMSVVPKSVGMGKSIISIEKAVSWKPQSVEFSCDGHRETWNNEEKTSKCMSSTTKISILGRLSSNIESLCPSELIEPAKATRITRSAVQKDAAFRDNSFLNDSTGEMALKSSTNRNKRACSAHQERQTLGVEMDTQFHKTLSDNSGKHDAVNMSNGAGSCDSVRTDACADDFAVSASTKRKRFTRLAIVKEIEPLAVVLEDKLSHVSVSNYSQRAASVVENGVNGRSNVNAHMRTESASTMLSAPTSRKRFTRSAVKEKESRAMEGNNKSMVGVELDSLEVTLADSESSECTKKSSTTGQTEGKVLGDDTRIQGQKNFISARMQLADTSSKGFLPRTRSQNKSLPTRNV